MAINSLTTLRSHGIPINSSRAWTTALAPNPRGGWNFITQSYQLHDQNPTEWVLIKDLTTSPTTVITNAEPTIYAHSQIQISNQKRASSNRIFFAEAANYLMYYDEASETFTQLHITDPAHVAVDSIFYSHEFGPGDGYLYLGTQSKTLPMICRVNVDGTPSISIIGHVGGTRPNTINYAYYIMADTATATKYIYVCVGQNPWDLVALNIDTGVQTVLKTVTNTGFMSLQARAEGIVATVDTYLGNAANVRTMYWCIDGNIDNIYTAGYNPATLPFTARNVTATTNPLTTPPQVDYSNGIGLVKWRANGSTGAYTSVQYSVNNSTPVSIESMLALQDGTILGNGEQYLGFFRYTPSTGVTSWYGPWSNGPSEPACLAHSNGKVYITGYPNCELWSYIPGNAWAPPTNPLLLGNFHATSNGKHTAFLAASLNGSLYNLGRAERDGNGSGLGRYIIATGAFSGVSTNLNFLNPSGLLVMDSVSRVVVSGIVTSDPNFPGQTPTTAQLVVYDLSLNEIERITVQDLLADTGELFFTNEPNVILGMTGTSAYRYDLAKHELLQFSSIGTYVAATQRTDDLTIWVVIGGVTCSINPDTLAVRQVAAVTSL